MKAAAARHTGLPFVAQPAPDELLAWWLLRLAQPYGQGLTTLASRLGALQAGEAYPSHWFSLDGSAVNLDFLCAAARLSQADPQAMTPLGCRPRWPVELGVCERCPTAATDAGQPVAWRRTWMNPLATACSIHGTWLKPVAARTLAGIRHGKDFGGAVQRLTTEPQPDGEPAWGSDALWLQNLCTAPSTVPAPRGAIRPQDLIQIADAVAGEVIKAFDSGADHRGLPADQRPGSVKNFAFEICNGERVNLALPTQLRHR